MYLQQRRTQVLTFLQLFDAPSVVTGCSVRPTSTVPLQALALIGSVVRVGGAISALLSADLPTRMFDSPLEFDSITGTYQITNGTATTKDLLYSSRAMKVLIAGDYGLASGRMDLDMTINHGRGEIKAKITGTTSSPSVRVAPGSLLKDLDKGGKTEKGLQDLLKRFGR